MQILVGTQLHEEDFMAQIAGNGGTETMRELGNEAKSRLHDVKEAAMDYGERFGGFVKDHPVPAILTGVGIGFLIGRLLSR